MREFLGWCDDVGVRVVSLYLLSSDNLRKRDSRELADLIEIIAELADGLSRERDWRVQAVRRTELVPGVGARVFSRTQGRPRANPGIHPHLALGSCGRKEIAHRL